MTIQQRGDVFVRSALTLLLSCVPFAAQPLGAQTQTDYVCRGFAVPTDTSGMPMATTNDGVVLVRREKLESPYPRRERS